MEGPVRPLRPRQGVRGGARGDHRPGGRPGDPLLLARRPSRRRSSSGRAPIPADFVATAVTELDGSSEIATYGAALQPHPGRRPEDRPDRPAERGRRSLPDQHGPGLRPQPAAAASRATPPCASALQAYQAAPPAQQKAGPTRTRRRSDNAKFPGGLPVAPTGPLRPRGADDELAGGARAQAAASTAPCSPARTVLPDQLHQAAALPLRRRLLRVAGQQASICSAPSGE